MALLIAPASVAQAQDATYLTPFVGIVNDDGSNPVVGGSVLFKLDPVSLEADFGFAWDSEDVGEASTSAHLVTFMANAVKTFPTGGIVEPYAAGGIGLVRASIDLDEIGLGSTSENKFGFNVGGGAYFFLTEKLGARADFRYFRPFADDESILNESDFIRLTGGLTFKF